MLESEAVKLWCPHLNRHCITRECMMWDHNPITTTAGKKKDKPKGDGWRGKKTYDQWYWTLDAAGWCKVRQDIRAL